MNANIGPEPDPKKHIAWIKWYRTKHGCGLSEAMTALEKREAEVASKPNLNRLHFFVSGKISDEANVRTLMDALRKSGHSITFDWTRVSHLKPYEKNQYLSRKTAIEECEGVKLADILILLVHDEGVGMFVELGIALGRGIPVYAVTNPPFRSMFLLHPLVTIVPSIQEITDRFCK